MEAVSTSREPVYGHELISLVLEMGGNATVEALQEAASARFGSDAIYGNCAGNIFSFEEVLAFLASRGKLDVRGGVVSAGTVPACGGH